MAQKPTYEELEQRVQELEAAVVACKKAEESLENSWELSQTDQTTTEEVLEKSEEKYRILTENSPLGVSLIGKDGRYQYVNKKFVEMFGYYLEEIPTGREWFAKAYPDPKYRHQVISLWLSDLQKSEPGEIRPRTCAVTCKDGSEKVIRFRPVSLETGDQLVIYEDITERKRVQEALQASDRKYRQLVEDINDVVYTIDANGHINYISPVIESVAGYRPSEIIGRPYTDFVHPEDMPRIMKLFEQILSGHIEPSEYRILTKSGDVCWVRTSSRAVKTDNDEVVLQGVLTDITARRRSEEALQEAHSALERRIEERTAELTAATSDLKRQMAELKHAQEALLASEEKYSMLVEHSLTGVFIHQDGKYVFVNDKFADMHGYEPQELIGQEALMLIHADDREALREIASKRLKGEEVPENYEVRRLRKDGKTVWCEMMATRIDYAGRPAIMGNIVDISERKNAEQAVQRKKEELEAQALSLEEVNTALRVLVRQREDDRRELERRVLANLKQLILPYIDTLKNSRLDEKQMSCVRIIESNLDNIASPFLGKLASKYFGLTPREIQIADLIKHGKTSKEIAQLLNVSPRAIEFHRENLRRKFGLKHQSANLRSHLLSFQ
jgi:PAS domain S-box-containing protein